MKLQKLIVSAATAAAILTQASRASAGSDETFAQTARLFYWLILGFPSAAKYDEVMTSTGDGAKELIPDSSGMAGRLEDIRGQVAKLIVANYPSIKTCSQSPTSGDLTLSSSETVSFKEATVTPPSSFPYTAKYDKRLIYTKTVSATSKYTVDFQWTCDKPIMYAKYDKYSGDTKAVSYVLFYDRSVDTNGHVQFYLSDTTGAIGGGGTMVLALHLNILADNKFKLWVTRSGVKNDTCQSYRTVVHGNYSTGESTILYQDIAGSGYSRTTIDNSTTLSAIFADKTVTNYLPVSGGNANSDSKIQVCVANFDENYKSKTSSAACTGSELSEAPVMGLDKDGDMSLKWVHDNLAAKIAAL